MPRKPQAIYGREALPAWSSSPHCELLAQGSLAAAALSPGLGPRRAVVNRSCADSSAAITAQHGLRPTQNERPSCSSRLLGASSHRAERTRAQRHRAGQAAPGPHRISTAVRRPAADGRPPAWPRDPPGQPPPPPPEGASPRAVSVG